jgi:hypothetical protein
MSRKEGKPENIIAKMVEGRLREFYALRCLVDQPIANELKFEDEADTAARNTIQSLSRKVPEGSREWDVLYRKYLEEEMHRRRKI